MSVTRLKYIDPAPHGAQLKVYGGHFVTDLVAEYQVPRLHSAGDTKLILRKRS